jgi:hypothetical protein
VEIDEPELTLSAWFWQVRASNISADGTIVRDKAFVFLLIWEYTTLWVLTGSPDLKVDIILFM